MPAVWEYFIRKIDNIPHTRGCETFIVGLWIRKRGEKLVNSLHPHGRQNLKVVPWKMEVPQAKLWKKEVAYRRRWAYYDADFQIRTKMERLWAVLLEKNPIRYQKPLLYAQQASKALKDPQNDRWIEHFLRKCFESSFRATSGEVNEKRMLKIREIAHNFLKRFGEFRKFPERIRKSSRFFKQL